MYIYIYIYIYICVCVCLCVYIYSGRDPSISISPSTVLSSVRQLQVVMLNNNALPATHPNHYHERHKILKLPPLFLHICHPLLLCSSFSSSDHHHGAHRLRTRDRSQSPEMRGLEEYPHKQIHMPRSDCKYDNSIGGGGGNRGSMRENYQNFHYVQQQPQQQQQSVPPSPATQVYVGNLSGRTDFNGLNRLFSRCGRILHIDVKCDQPEIATPHAVITFAFESSVSDAVHFYSETELDGHVIVVCTNSASISLNLLLLFANYNTVFVIPSLPVNIPEKYNRSALFHNTQPQYPYSSGRGPQI